MPLLRSSPDPQRILGSARQPCAHRQRAPRTARFEGLAQVTPAVQLSARESIHWRAASAANVLASLSGSTAEPSATGLRPLSGRDLRSVVAWYVSVSPVQLEPRSGRVRADIVEVECDWMRCPTGLITAANTWLVCGAKSTFTVLKHLTPVSIGA